MTGFRRARGRIVFVNPVTQVSEDAITNLTITFSSTSDHTCEPESNTEVIGNSVTLTCVRLEDSAREVTVTSALEGLGWLAAARAGFGAKGWHL